MKRVRKAKKVLRKLIISPVYAIYYCFFELLLGFGVEDIWDRLVKWSER